jgi:hypothetical protein
VFAVVFFDGIARCIGSAVFVQSPIHTHVAYPLFWFGLFPVVTGMLFLPFPLRVFERVSTHLCSHGICELHDDPPFYGYGLFPFVAGTLFLPFPLGVFECVCSQVCLFPVEVIHWKSPYKLIFLISNLIILSNFWFVKDFFNIF